MKRFVTFTLLLAVLCGTFVLSAFAEERPERLVDGAELLTKSEAKELENKLDEISEKHNVDVVIVTVDSIGYQSPSAFADDFYDDNKYGIGEDRDGVMLLISMEERDWDILANGLCNDAITASDRESIGENMLDDLSAGNFAEAFNIFADECEFYINGYINGYPFEAGPTFVVSLVIGVAAAFIVTGIMKRQLKSVRANDTATEYVKRGSMNVTYSRDLFLYRHISRREKPQNNSSGRSSGGGRGHSGGKF